MPQKTSQSGWWQRVSYPQFGMWILWYLLHVSFVLLVKVSETLTEKEDEARSLDQMEMHEPLENSNDAERRKSKLNEF
jgi:hypothetical protein